MRDVNAKNENGKVWITANLVAAGLAGGFAVVGLTSPTTLLRHTMKIDAVNDVGCAQLLNCTRYMGLAFFVRRLFTVFCVAAF